LNALQQGMTTGVVRQYVPTLNGPAHIWFSQAGQTAFVISQKVPMIEIFDVNPDRNGLSRPKLKMRLDIREFDRFGFTPFQKTTPSGKALTLYDKKINPFESNIIFSSQAKLLLFPVKSSSEDCGFGRNLRCLHLALTLTTLPPSGKHGGR